jgi:2-dehydropantoate 2-reductase
MKPMLKIAVVGAGAVGCYYGAMLARAGYQVTMIGRPVHVDATRQRGLVLETEAFTEVLRVEATTDLNDVSDAGLVLFCVKSDDTVDAATAIENPLNQEAIVVSLQNGVDNADRLEAILRRRVVPAAVYVAAEMASAGHVRHNGRGELIIGDGPYAQDVVQVFRRATVPIEISDDMPSVLWQKLIVNCAYNAISAISLLPYGRMTLVDGVPELMREIVNECLAVARRQNVRLPEGMADEVSLIAKTMPNQFSSTAQDLTRGRRTEIGSLNGYVVRTGEALGVATPVNRTLLTLVRLLEEKASGSG